jgi:hypothetical protein
MIYLNKLKDYLRSPIWSIQHTRCQTITNKCRYRQDDNPPKIHPKHQPPVHAFEPPVAQSHTNSRTDNTLRGRDWDIETSGDDDTHDVAKLHREAPARTVEADAIAEVAHHAILGNVSRIRMKNGGKDVRHRSRDRLPLLWLYSICSELETVRMVV